MRIMLFACHYETYRLDGTWVSVNSDEARALGMARAFRARGCEVDVVCATDGACEDGLRIIGVDRLTTADMATYDFVLILTSTLLMYPPDSPLPHLSTWLTHLEACRRVIVYMESPIFVDYFIQHLRRFSAIAFSSPVAVGRTRRLIGEERPVVYWPWALSDANLSLPDPYPPRSQPGVRRVVYLGALHTRHVPMLNAIAACADMELWLAGHYWGKDLSLVDFKARLDARINLIPSTRPPLTGTLYGIGFPYYLHGDVGIAFSDRAHEPISKIYEYSTYGLPTVVEHGSLNSGDGLIAGIGHSFPRDDVSSMLAGIRSTTMFDQPQKHVFAEMCRVAFGTWADRADQCLALVRTLG